MGAFSSFVLGGVAERLVPAIHTPVEDIIYEVLDQKGLPTRTEVRDLRNKLERLEKTIADLTSTLEGLRDQVATAATRAAQAAETASSDNGPEPARAGRRPVGRPPVGPRDCKLVDCDGAVRAKGFCGKHYQKWKRGTLDGYINFDGTTVHGDVRYLVGDDHLGEVVETTYEGDEVIFLLPQSGGITIRHKVNDARIDV